MALEQTDEEINVTHRRIWEAKPQLRASYGRYHGLLLDECPRDGVIVELGAGIGHMTAAARARGYTRWVSTEILPVDRVGVRCDALRLPFRTGSVDRIVFIDVLHHLGAPKAFFREAARALKPGGKVVCIEPWVTAFSYPIYRFIHHEGCDLSRDVDAPFARGAKKAYEGDGGLPTLLCRKIDATGWRELGFGAPAVEPMNDFAYLTTRGFREGRDSPRAVFRATRVLLDGFLSPFARWLGMRALLRWERVVV
jgi:SAM-dependent methyltransferase